MFPLIIASFIMISGLGLVAFLLWTESRREKKSLTDEFSAEKPAETDSSALLARLGLEEHSSLGKTSNKKIRKSFFAFGKQRSPSGAVVSDSSLAPLPDTALLNVENTKGTATLRLDKVAKKDFAPETELALEAEDLRLKVKELTAKYEKLDSLCHEKNEELEKTRKDLASELRNRKEFNKIKDILEKELKDMKDRLRISQNEVTAAQTEAQSNNKRVTQLEEKIRKLEKEIKEREEALKTGTTESSPNLNNPLDIREKLAQTEALLAEKEKKISSLLEILEKNSQIKNPAEGEEGKGQPQEIPASSPETPAGSTNNLESVPIIPANPTDSIPTLGQPPLPNDSLAPQQPAESIPVPLDNTIPPPADVEAKKTINPDPMISKLKPINPEYLKILEETSSIPIPPEEREENPPIITEQKTGRSDMTTKSLLQTIEDGIEKIQPPTIEHKEKDLPDNDRSHLIKDVILTNSKFPEKDKETKPPEKPTVEPSEPDKKE